MIRPVTLLAFIAFIGSGLYLYQIKHQAQLVDRQIRRVQDATQVAAERVRLLRSEYELLNNPDRLAELAATYVPALKPTQPGQWSSMAEIERRLPAVGAATAAPEPLERAAPAIPQEEPPVALREREHEREREREPGPAPVAAVPVQPEATLAPQPAAMVISQPPAPRQPAPPHAAPVVAAKPLPHASLAPAALPPSGGPLRTASVVEARPVPARPHIAPALAPVPAPVTAQVTAAALAPRRPAVATGYARPAGASVLAVSARPAVAAYVPPPSTPAEAVARIAHGGPVDPSVPAVASALGMARTMMAVSPVSSANAHPVFSQATQ
jgi:hypothetical protein